MDEVKKERKPRVISAEVRVKQIDKKINKLKAQIAEFEDERVELLKPIRMKQAVDDAIKSMSTQELAEKLGIEIE